MGFARARVLRASGTGRQVESPGKTPRKTLGKTPGKTPGKILDMLKRTPGLSIPEIAAHLEKSASAVERAIRKLKSTGKLARVGPAKGGHWKVTD
jgi:ATP-dependent DNA helicase RecG